jgi:hypothetical protein
MESLWGGNPLSLLPIPATNAASSTKVSATWVMRMMAARNQKTATNPSQKLRGGEMPTDPDNNPDHDQHNILRDTFCIYCQVEYEEPAKLQTHVLRRHPDTYAAHSIRLAREKKRGGGEQQS